MSTPNEPPEYPDNDSDDEEETQVNELELLKNRAKLMGIPFSNNISVETLQAKIQAKMDEAVTPGPKVTATATISAANPTPNPLIGETPDKPRKKLTLRQYMRDTQMKLVRVRITCMDPKKKDLQGEILTVANEYLGTVRKYIPFGELTDEGYHIPFCLYTMLEQRKFLNIRTIKDRRTNTTRVEATWVREFAIEVLPQLTQAELTRLGNAQIAAGSVDNTISAL
jgi:hypothetical protein